MNNILSRSYTCGLKVSPDYLKLCKTYGLKPTYDGYCDFKSDKSSKERFDYVLSNATPTLRAENRDNTYTVKSVALNMCPNTKVIKKYIPRLAKTVSLAVPCNKCAYCSHHKQNAWILRARNQAKLFKYSYFVTLTYNEQHLEECNPDTIRHFFARLRRQNTFRFTYFLTAEHGTKSGRPHYHFLLFTDQYSTRQSILKRCEFAWSKRGSNNERDYLGFVYVGNCTHRSIAYATKYTIKDIGSNQLFHRSSIGFGYANLEKDVIIKELSESDKAVYKTEFTQTYTNGDIINNELKTYTVPVPSYYRNKLLDVNTRTANFDSFLQSEGCSHKIRAANSPIVMCHYKDMYEVYKEKSIARRHINESKQKVVL